MRLARSFHRPRRGAAAFVFVCAGLSGCVGSLDDPQRFTDGTYCPPEIEVEQLFAERCGGAICHGAGAESAGGLDLESPGLAERLVNVPAEGCSGWELAVPDDPDSSFLLSKLEGPPPGCGERMPTVGYLSENEITCVREWIVAAGDEVADFGGLDGGVQE